MSDVHASYFLELALLMLTPGTGTGFFSSVELRSGRNYDFNFWSSVFIYVSARETTTYYVFLKTLVIAVSGKFESMLPFLSSVSCYICLSEEPSSHA